MAAAFVCALIAAKLQRMLYSKFVFESAFVREQSAFEMFFSLIFFNFFFNFNREVVECEQAIKNS